MEKDRKLERLPSITPQYAGEDEVLVDHPEQDPYAGNEGHSVKIKAPPSSESLTSESADGNQSDHAS